MLHLFCFQEEDRKLVEALGRPFRDWMPFALIHDVRVLYFANQMLGPVFTLQQFQHNPALFLSFRLIF